MAFVVACPQCQTRHQVGDEMRGQAARCRCGAVIQIPAAPGASAPANGSLLAQCPGCSKTHQADASLAGQMVRCGCGHTFQVPGGNAVAAAADPFGGQGSADPFGAGGQGSADPFGAGGLGGAAPNPFADQDPLGAPMSAAPSMPAAAPYDPMAYAPSGGQASSRPSGGKKKGKKKGNPGRCPKCGSSKYATPIFTWWGGMIGQHIMSHVVCDRCRTQFNSKTGASNTTNIILYHVVIIGVILAFSIPVFLLSLLE